MIKEAGSIIKYAVYLGMAVWLASMICWPGPALADQGTENNSPVVLSDAFLYYADIKNGHLKAVARQFDPGLDAHKLGRTVLEALLEDPPAQGLLRVFPEDTRVNALFITESGNAFLDLSFSRQRLEPTDTMTEYLSIYSLVNTLAVNIPDIKQVKILLNGEEGASLGGHISLEPFFKTNMLIVK